MWDHIISPFLVYPVHIQIGFSPFADADNFLVLPYRPKDGLLVLSILLFILLVLFFISALLVVANQ